MKVSALFITILVASTKACPQVSGPHEIGRVTDHHINEASGLVASQTNKDVFWTFNDSQGPHCIYAGGPREGHFGGAGGSGGGECRITIARAR